MQMSVKRAIIFTFFGVQIIISNSCNSVEGCDLPVPGGEFFLFKLLDKKTNSNLIGAWGTKYASDKVNLLKEDGTEANNLEIGADGNISFIIPDTNDEALNTEITRTFLLHLPDVNGNLSQDIDTLIFKYTFFKDEMNCPNIWYNSFLVIYNDSIYHNGEYLSYVEFRKRL